MTANILKIKGITGTWCDKFGSKSDVPEIAICMHTKLVIDLRSDKTTNTGELVSISSEVLRQCDSFQCVLENDFDPETAPKLIQNDGIELIEKDGLLYLGVTIPNTNHAGLKKEVAKNKELLIGGELIGKKADLNAGTVDDIFVVQFDIKIKNRRYTGEIVPPVTGDDERDIFTKSEIMALINALEKPQKGDRGYNNYELAVQNGFKGTLSEWLLTQIGPTGKSSYELAVQNGFIGTVAEYLDSLKGDKGEDGLSTYQLAVQNGFIGTVSDFLLYNKGTDGNNGKDGDGVYFDISGELSELPAYGREPTGFKFAYNDNQGNAYIYTKKSDEFNDWSTPLRLPAGINGINGKDGENVKFLPPCDFEFAAGSSHFYVDMEKYKAVHINCVCIDTVDGELRLPFDSALGVEKVLRKQEKSFKDGKEEIKDLIYLYFGKLVPQFETGRVYFAQGVTNLYVNPPVDPPEPPVTEKMYYGYLDGLSSVSDLTTLTDLTEIDLKSMDKFSVGFGSAGQVLAVVIPSSSPFVATKFNGINGDVPFAENAGATGTGANGKLITINEKDYKIYGEFILSTGERFIYVK